MLHMYSGAFVRLGFGEHREACLVGCKLVRSILRADFAAVMLIEGDGYSCAAHSGLSASIAAQWRGHPVVRRIVAATKEPRAISATAPELEGDADLLGVHEVLLAVPMFDIDTTRGQMAVAFVGGHWVGRDVELTLTVLQIITTLLAGAMSNCRLREQYERLYAELDVARSVAEEHSRAKDRFLARMSHELRTPLNIIIGYSELVLESLEEAPIEVCAEDPAEQLSLVRPIRTAGHHLLSIVNDVLDISKLHSGEVKPTIEPADYGDLARTVVDELSVLADQNRNTLELDIAAEVRGRTDKRMVRQILYNLVANACKFTEHGRIVVRVWSAPQVSGAAQVHLEVEDQGIGISEADLERVFDDFVQVDDSTTRRHGGTGLGLSVSRALARLLGGTLRAQSEIGRGSTFRLSVLQDLDAPESEAILSPREKVVVVISANRGEQALVCRYLERGGHRAVRSSGLDGFEVAAVNRASAVILDAALPHGETAIVLEHLREDARTAKIPVALIASAPNAAIEQKVQGVLVRPLLSDQLTRVLAELLGTRMLATV